MSDTNTIIKTCTITAGSSLSGAVDLSSFSTNKDNYRMHAIVIPSSWTSASITFQTSIDGGSSWNDIYDADIATGGTNYEISAGANRYILVDQSAFSSVSMLKIRSGTVSSPINQENDTVLSIVLRAY